MKAPILIFSVVLLAASCTEETKTTEKTTKALMTDTVKTTETIPKPDSQATALTTDTTETITSNKPQINPLLVGSWTDVDPEDPGPGNQELTFDADGQCRVSEQEGGYMGYWTYDAASGILNMKLAHVTGSGEIDTQTDNDYKVEEVTDARIKLSDVTGAYPMLGGSFWKTGN